MFFCARSDISTTSTFHYCTVPLFLIGICSDIWKWVPTSWVLRPSHWNPTCLNTNSGFSTTDCSLTFTLCVTISPIYPGLKPSSHLWLIIPLLQFLHLISHEVMLILPSNCFRYPFLLIHDHVDNLRLDLQHFILEPLDSLLATPLSSSFAHSLLLS